MDSVVQSILDGLKALFVPSDGFLNEKIDYIKVKFGFVSSVVISVKNIIKSLYDYDKSEPPVIAVNLASTFSKYDYGTEAVILDLSWYAPYKNTVDNVLSGILWLFFIWRLFIKLPSVINGVSGSVGPASDVYSHFSDR